MSSFHGKRPAGFALPMTLIAIAGLTLLLVGLLTVLGLERKTARSYSNSARADLAVESGLAHALGLLTEVAGRDDSIVFRIEDPVQSQVDSTERPLGFREQFFTYGALYENGSWRGIPLFSGATETALGSREIESAQLAASLADYSKDAIQIGRISEHDQNIPRAKWIEVPSSDPKGYTMRYAFWVEDLTGLVDGTSAGLKPRDLGLDPSELDITTILDPANDSGNFPQPLDEKRAEIRTSATVRQLLSIEQAKRIEPYITYLPLSISQLPPKIIPQGFGYADAGMKAPDLNTFAAASDVTGIADHIEKQIPTFKNRRGGFPDSEDYVKTIAASIIDYADTDGNATTGAGYRGVDSYPFVNELFDRYEWIAGASGQVAIRVETFVELWNPTQQSVTGRMEFTNVNYHTIKIPLTGETKFSEVQFAPQNVTIPPNGFTVIAAGERTYTFPEGAFPPSELDFIDPTKNDDNAVAENTFQLKWNGTLVDTARGGLQRTDGLLRPGSSQRKWKGNGSPAHDWSIGQSGDPRSSWYINTKVFGNSFDKNSNWGGRALKEGIGATKPYREVRLENWADRGSNSTVGVSAGTDARVPTDTRIILKSSGAPIAGKTYPPNQPDHAPSFISNSGSYIVSGELGNIYDPAQWDNVESASGVASDRAGGGFTLAIGRPEFAVFDKDGMRAAQLLDIFTVGEKPMAPARPVNINTAPREVLRTLIAGVVLDADPIAPGVKPKKDRDIGDIFADHVISQRTASPLRGLSDMNNIRKNPLVPRNPTIPADTPFFGNPDLHDNAPVITDPITEDIEWDDAGREELFRKVMNMAGFTSKSFRIVVAGEARDLKGNLLARASREYHYVIEPERDATSMIVPNGKLNIRKHYENSL
jgi:hypothetical protein